MANVLVDTSFWIALLKQDKPDDFYKEANEIWLALAVHRVIVPWPCLYETLSTRFAERSDSFRIFEEKLDPLQFERFDDREFRERALTEFFLQRSKEKKDRLSLTDLVIREILTDRSVEIHKLVTFDKALADLHRNRPDLEVWP